MIVIYLKKKDEKMFWELVFESAQKIPRFHSQVHSLYPEKLRRTKLHFLRVFIIGNVCIFYFEIHTYIIYIKM